MREVAIRIWDDLAAADGIKDEAVCTVTVGFEGRWRELDLNAEHLRELQEDLRRWMESGRAVKGAVPPKPVPREQREIGEDGKMSTSGLRVREWEHGRAWGIAIRAFADENGMNYTTPAGKWYYSRELRDAYAESIGRA